METQADYDTANDGLDALEQLDLSSLDGSSRAILIGKLGNMLVGLVSPTGTFCANVDGTLYEIRMVVTGIVKIP